MNASWSTMKSSQNVLLTFEASNPGIISKAGFTLPYFEDNVVFQVYPKASIKTTCPMTDMSFNWWWHSNDTHAAMLSNNFWIQFKKGEVFGDKDELEKNLVVEMKCILLNLTFYDFLIVDADNYQAENAFSVIDSANYELSPFADPYVVKVTPV